MKTPKEKAEELISKFDKLFANSYLNINKNCALICVDEIIKEHTFIYYKPEYEDIINYWNKVKEEINKIN